MYKIIDGQGGSLKADEEHKTLDEVRESLASFHSIDVDGAEEMSLQELCDIGTWDVVTGEDVSIFD